MDELEEHIRQEADKQITEHERKQAKMTDKEIKEKYGTGKPPYPLSM